MTTLRRWGMRSAVVLVLIWGAAAGAESAAPPAVAKVVLRAEAGHQGPPLARLPVDAVVRLLGCGGDWCRVRHGSLVGFVAAGDLRRLLVAPPPPARGYTNARNTRVRSPADTADGAPPAGAAARCRDGTFSFSQSRSGTCSHHGGVGRWFD